MAANSALSTGNRVAVVGLGYVGLPLAVAMARHFDTVGYDIDAVRIEELGAGNDRTGEIETARLRATAMELTDDASHLASADIVILTVPTPVDAENNPDLKPLRAACADVGPYLKRGVIVCVESTVYPGVTEEVCGPDLERASGLVFGKDFFVGYSPERINPGDRKHTLDRIVKVVAGQTPEVTERLAAVYGRITDAGVFIARDIRTAEAAKVIENAQRDINIAFVNEATMIFQKMGLSAYDVLAAASTKWNFLEFTPGLVGGHCIGVDPFYLAHRAVTLGHNPEVILAGRRINDSMGHFIAERIHDHMERPGSILVLGLTFKENVPDLRNTRVIDIVEQLTRAGHDVTVHDPLAHREEARELYGIELIESLVGLTPFDAIVGAVAHDAYKALTAANLDSLVAPGGLIADIKGIWRHIEIDRRRWQL